MKRIVMCVAMVGLLAGPAWAWEGDDRPYPRTMEEMKQQQAEDREEFRYYEPQTKKLNEALDKALEEIEAKNAEKAAKKKKSWW